MKEITVKISNSNFEKLKRATQKDRIVNVALKQFFQKNHKIKIGAFGKSLTCDGGKTKMYLYRNFFFLC